MAAAVGTKLVCHNSGVDYVSCSPYRIPIVRMAAAQAAIAGG